MNELPPELDARRDAIHDRVVRRGTARRRVRQFTGVLSGVVVLALAVGVAWTRIDASGSRNTADRDAEMIFAATTGADTARVHTVLAIRIGKTTEFVESSGFVDFARQRGDVIARALPTSSPKPTSPETNSPVETRWIGDAIYTTDRYFGGGNSGWTLVNAAKFYAASSCLAKFDIVSILSGAAVTVSPDGVLNTLRASGSDLKRVGTATIRGIKTTHWRVAPRQAKDISCDRNAASQGTTRGGLGIYTDGQNRALRLVLSSTTTFPHSDGVLQIVKITTDFSDFGAPVTVQAPPADQVTDRTAALIASNLGTGSATASDWHDVAHGVIGATPWMIDAAHTTTGWNCYDLSDTPGNQQSGTDAPADNNNPKHNGHATACLLAGSEFEWIDGPVGLLIDSTHANQRVIVGAVTGMGAARLIFKDGSTQQLTVDPNTWIFNWSGPASRTPIRIQIGGQSCRVDTQNDQPTQPDWTLNTASSCMTWTPGSN